MQQNLIKSFSSNDMTVANDTNPIFDILTQILWNWKFGSFATVFLLSIQREFSKGLQWNIRLLHLGFCVILLLLYSRNVVFSRRKIFSNGIKGSFFSSQYWLWTCLHWFCCQKSCWSFKFPLLARSWQVTLHLVLVVNLVQPTKRGQSFRLKWRKKTFKFLISPRYLHLLTSSTKINNTERGFTSFRNRSQVINFELSSAMFSILFD